MKYIVVSALVKGAQEMHLPFIFADYVVHDDMLKAVQSMLKGMGWVFGDVVSAGFLSSVDLCDVSPHGKSTTIAGNPESRGKTDTQLFSMCDYGGCIQ